MECTEEAVKNVKRKTDLLTSEMLTRDFLLILCKWTHPYKKLFRKKKKKKKRVFLPQLIPLPIFCDFVETPEVSANISYFVLPHVGNLGVTPKRIAYRLNP